MIKGRVTIWMLIISILLTSCSLNRNVAIEQKKYNNSEVLEMISKSYIKDGYRFLNDELSNNLDLYTTYYAQEINGIFEINDLEHKKEILSLPEEKIRSLLFDFDNRSLMNIYYLCELFDDKKNISNELAKSIETYILQLQTSRGSFALSQSVKGENNDPIENELLSTYYALEILRFLNVELDYNSNEKLKSWFIAVSNSKKIKEPAEISDSGYMLTFLRISLLVGEKSISLTEEYHKQLNFYNRKVNELYKSGSQIDLINLKDIFDLNVLLDNDIDKVINKEVFQIIIKLYDNNYSFKLTQNSPPDILSTYLALSILRENNYDISRFKPVISNIDKFRLSNGYYIPFGEIESDYSNTFYVSSILNVLNLNEEKQQLIEDFTNENRIETIDNLKNLFFYFKIIKNLRINIISEEKKENLLNQFMNDFNTINDSWEIESIYENYYYLIEIIYELGGELNSQQKESVAKHIESMNEKHVLLINYNFQLINLLKLEMKKEYLIENKKYLLNELDSILLNEDETKNSKLILLYYIISALDSVGFSPNETMKTKIYHLKEKSYLSNGLFKSGPNNDDLASFQSTFFALWLNEYLSSV
ncbi:prenyltransferase/squalene oxidase repeat-containing protein [Paenibacillus sp. FSL R7-0128]|uniref:prenyltransferase/squalene oxidase repeat-containing protein n=1 Tax=Paenibacillus sp. FSL R7-0128 TaxID=2954529 RepID=UPI0030F6068F